MGSAGPRSTAADGRVGEEHQRQVAELAGALGLGRAGLGHERAVHVGDELDEGAVPGQGRGDAVDNVGGRRQRGQRAQGRGAPGQVGFEGITLLGELLEAAVGRPAGGSEPGPWSDSVASWVRSPRSRSKVSRSCAPRLR